MASAGRILLIPRGRYDSTVTYQMLDVVLHNGVSWVCKVEVTGVEPSDQAIEWQRFTEDIYKDVIGDADISGIGDGTIKGAIANTASLAKQTKESLTGYATKDDFTLNGTTLTLNWL